MRVLTVCYLYYLLLHMRDIGAFALHILAIAGNGRSYLEVLVH